MSDRGRTTSTDDERWSLEINTEAAEERARMNAIRNAMLGEHTVVGAESAEVFQAVAEEYYDRFEPFDSVEGGLTDELISSRWRMRRLWAMESHMLARQVEQQTSGDEMDCICGAWEILSETPKFKQLQRYEAHLQRTFDRSLHTLVQMKKYPVPFKDSGEEQSPEGLAVNMAKAQLPARLRPIGPKAA